MPVLIWVDTAEEWAMAALFALILIVFSVLAVLYALVMTVVYLLLSVKDKKYLKE